MRWGVGLGIGALAALLLGCPYRSAPESAKMSRPLSPAEAVDLDPAPDVLRVRLEAAPLAGAAPYSLAFDGHVPGPTLRARDGDTVVVELVNGLEEATGLHFHGVAVPTEVEGSAFAPVRVAPGATTTYTFTVPRAGTFWYHPLADAQVDAGLYGALIVEDPAEPAPDEALVLVFDVAGEHDPARDGASAHGLGRVRTRWLVNGQFLPTYRARGGAVVRARLINASSFGYLALRWPQMRQIGSDQGLLPALHLPERLELAPGDRADVELLVGGAPFEILSDPYSLNGGDRYGDPFALVKVEIDGPTAPPAGLGWPFAGGAPSADPPHTDIVYAFAGSDRTGTWRINGERFPNVTVEEIAPGEDAIIELRNLSPTEHPFHLFGHAFEVLSVNGVASPHRTLEDTFNVKIRDRVRLRVHGNNPGEWRASCQLGPHGDDGMTTVLRVLE